MDRGSGFKSSFVLAVLPAAMLYYWRSSTWTLLPLGLAAVCAILLGYVFFAGSPSIGDALNSMAHRLFVYQGDVAWWVWDLHREGEPLRPMPLHFFRFRGPHLLACDRHYP